MRKAWRLLYIPASFALTAIGLGDSSVTMRVDVANPPDGHDIRIPAVGDYAFTLGKEKTRVVFPNGDLLLIDFEKKTASLLDTVRKTFYQLKLADFLSYGDRISPSMSSQFSVKSTVTFAPTVGQEGRTILGESAMPFNLDLEADLSRQRPSGGGGGGFGRHRGGGGGFPGGLGFQSIPGAPSGFGQNVASKGCRIGGELWMGSVVPAGIDRDQLNTSLECAFMFGLPELKGLADRIHKTNSILLGADYSVSILDSQGNPPAKAPVVSIKVSAIGEGTLDPAGMVIPGDYSKVGAPEIPLGS